MVTVMFGATARRPQPQAGTLADTATAPVSATDPFTALEAKYRIHDTTYSGSAETPASPYHLGPRGGCYAYTGNGRKRYADHSYCQ